MLLWKLVLQLLPRNGLLAGSWFTDVLQWIASNEVERSKVGEASLICVYSFVCIQQYRSSSGPVREPKDRRVRLLSLRVTWQLKVSWCPTTPTPPVVITAFSCFLWPVCVSSIKQYIGEKKMISVWLNLTLSGLVRKDIVYIHHNKREAYRGLLIFLRRNFILTVRVVRHRYVVR